jgi:phosphatidate cytidylyltransferase
MDAAAARRSSTLHRRVASAIILIPVGLAAVWLGPPWLPIVVGIAGIAMAWEWGRLVSAQPWGPTTAIVMATVALAVLAAALHWFLPALAVAGLGAVAAAHRREWGWTLSGTLWVALSCVAFLWLAANGGRVTIIWLLLVVWATDIFAYLVGKTIGGPRLMPRLSPNKTWAGFFGGLAGGAVAGLSAALAIGAHVAPITLISLGLSLTAQGGDLAESSAKRYFAVKDMSALIPGHGGVLDRLDGLLAATMTAALLAFATGISEMNLE